MREVLVRDQSKCIQCESCVSACRNRHGRARMTMSGIRMGHYQLPKVCRQCTDAPCLRACVLGGMRRDGDIVYVSDACRGCKQCTVACPYGAVTPVARGEDKTQGLVSALLAQVFRNDPAPRVSVSILTDATRCIQCGICSSNCPAGIAVRDYSRAGQTMDDPRCVACGLCVAKCPRRALEFAGAPELPLARMRADKCDLCRDYSESACVKQCPTGSLQRLPTDQGLVLLGTSVYRTITEPSLDKANADSLSDHRKRNRGIERRRGDPSPQPAVDDHSGRR